MNSSCRGSCGKRGNPRTLQAIGECGLLLLVLVAVASEKCTLASGARASSHSSVDLAPRTKQKPQLPHPLPGDAPALPKPDKDDYARMARWLVASTSWGTLSTLTPSRMPNGGLKSHSDVVRGHPSGRLFLYLSPMDVSTQDLMVAAHSAYSVSEMQLEQPGALCHGVDPEDPTCAKVTLVGVTLPVDEDDLDTALDALFERHPSMQDWPEGHRFMPYELHVHEAHLLDWYGGMKVISGRAYYDADPDLNSATTTSAPDHN